MKPHASLKLGSCVTCLYMFFCIHHRALYASANHFKGLDLHLCSYFAGHRVSPQENNSSQPCKGPSSTQRAYIQDSREFSLQIGRAHV